MTDNIKGFTVTLIHDYREDDARGIIDAIQMIKGVESVGVHVADYTDHMARMRIKGDIRIKFLELYDSI